MPAGARPGRGNARRARARRLPRAPAPLRLWRAEVGAAVVAAAADVARLPGGGNNAGPAKQKGSLRLLPRLSLALPGLRAGSSASRGRSPGGPEPRAPRPPRAPRSPCPRSAGVRPHALGLQSRGIRPYCPRGAPRARPGSWAAPARAPTGLREQEPGAPRKPSPRRRRRCCPPDAAAIGVSLFFFFLPILMGRKVTAYFAFINSHHNNKNPGAKAASGRDRRRGAAGRDPQAGAKPRAPSGDTGPGAQTKDVLGCWLRVLRPPPPRVAQ